MVQLVFYMAVISDDPPLLCIDIDGTLTPHQHSIPAEMLQLLEEFTERGWKLTFITGRTFVRTKALLEVVEVPFSLSTLNGAQGFSFPDEKALFSHPFPFSIIEEVGGLARDLPLELVLYTGSMERDVGYHYLQSGHEPLKTHLIARVEHFHESLVAFEMKQFACFKCFGERENIVELRKKIQEKGLPVNFSMVTDPYNSNFTVLLGTADGVDKGHALHWFKEYYGAKTLVVAAGNDLNDLPMLRESDYAIAMKNAPQELKDQADFVCPHVEELGLIEGLLKVEEVYFQNGERR